MNTQSITTKLSHTRLNIYYINLNKSFYINYRYTERISGLVEY